MSNRQSYRQILRSSSMMGLVAIITLLLGMIRTKFAAVLIGPEGTGQVASYAAILGMVGAIAGLGIQGSGVREVASAYASQDDRAAGRTVLALRRVCWLTGLLGATAMVVFSPWLSQWTFGHADHAFGISILGAVILLNNLQEGQMTLVHGTRRISHMAQGQIIGAVLGTIITVTAYMQWGGAGIVPALVLMACVQWMIAIHYAKKVPVTQVDRSWRQSLSDARAMLKLGLALMWTGVFANGAVYLINVLITSSFGIKETGLYSAALTLSAMSVSFVLNAMAADYYPRLAGSADDHPQMNRLVNEQTEIGLLLALPMLVMFLVLSDWAVVIFYTEKFAPATELIHWFVLGCLGRVISWPMGYMMIALNRGQVYLVTELSFHVMHFVMVFVGIRLFGIQGAAMAFCVMYVIYPVAVYLIVKRLTGFVWTSQTWQIVMGALCAVFLMFVLVGFAQTLWLRVIEVLLGCVMGWMCLNEVSLRLTGQNVVFAVRRKLKKFLVNDAIE